MSSIRHDVRKYLMTSKNSSWRFLVCWSLTSLFHSNGHMETMPAREINPFTALTRIRSQFLRTQWSTSNHQRVNTTTPQTVQPSGLASSWRKKVHHGFKTFVTTSKIRHDIKKFIVTSKIIMTSKSVSWCQNVHDVKNTSVLEIGTILREQTKVVGLI